MKTHLVLPAILAASLLAITGCNRSSHSQSEVRAEENGILLPITTHNFVLADAIVGEYQLTKERPYYLIRLLKFEDGKVLPDAISSVTGDERTRSAWIYMISSFFKRRNDKLQMEISSNGTGTAELWAPEFIKKLFSNGVDKKSRENVRYHDLRILAHIASKTGTKPQFNDSSILNFPQCVKEKKYVIAIAIKTFATKAELDQYAKSAISRR